jgi:2-polyprenyl-3-methyl-5-hydroxy-6-metoxy-1,4-benzoquinol methylase
VRQLRQSEEFVDSHSGLFGNRTARLDAVNYAFRLINTPSQSRIRAELRCEKQNIPVNTREKFPLLQSKWPMAFFPNLSKRRVHREAMDDPDLPVQPHQEALHGLVQINRWSGSDSILWPSLRRLALEKTGQSLRVLDIATGAGDIPIRLFHRAQRAGFSLQFSGVDISPTAIAFARDQARLSGASVEFYPLDVMHRPLPAEYDVIMSSLFLHHLDRGAATNLLAQMGAAARTMVLVNDLIRSQLGFWLAWLGTRALSSSAIVHMDGPQSVEAAFTMAEAQQMAEEAGLIGATVSWRRPSRFLLQWSRKP